MVDALSAVVSRYAAGGGGGGAAPASAAPSPFSASGKRGGSGGGSGGGGGSGIPDLTPEELARQLSAGAVAGFCSGYALKKASKLLALAIGLGFIAVQVLRFNGLIGEVEWATAEKRLTQLLDADGDGRVTPADLHTHARRAIDVLGFNAPSAAAFGAALLLGFRVG